PSPGKARRWIVGIMGGGTHRGRWRIAERCTVVNLMGGADLDLTEAIVESAETEIRVFSLMGGSDVVVPEGVHVELSGFAFMGGNDFRLEGRPAPPAGAPVVRVHAYSIMGGTDVKPGPTSRRRHASHHHA
ncbi:MAG: LiaF domain-containing protein, partial [Thermoleophilaceae bacterium]